MNKNRKPRSFYVIEINNGNIGSIIEGIRFFANPNSKYRAHITVRGPYDGHKPIGVKHSDVEKWNTIVANKEIVISGVGKFIGDNQQTIFLNCSHSLFLREIWKKDDYPDFTPHITIYDGPDKDFAFGIFDSLSCLELSLTFKAERLEVLESSKQLKIFNILAFNDKKILRELLGSIPNREDVEKMTIKERLDKIAILGAALNT